MHFYLGRIYEIDFDSAPITITVQECRTKENAHKNPEELRYNVRSDEVKVINGTFYDLVSGEEETVLFSVTHFGGQTVVDTIEIPVYDD